MESFMSFWRPLNLLLLICNIPVNCLPMPRVSTKLGEFIGKFVNVTHPDTGKEIQVEQFLSVPYAKPPLDDLRLRRPETLTELPTGLLKCSQMPNACIQFTDSEFPWAIHQPSNNPHVDEDCLYLNIWVPPGVCPHDKKSVLFWIHGGGFTSGSIRLEIYNGKVLAALGDVIVVTTNYRLGALGFWTHATDDPRTKNIGIWDVIQALRWVKEHIADFGGDKNSVTIAGQDAGAIIVSLLAVSPYAKDLFKRQIVQSGSAMSPFMVDSQNPISKTEIVAKAAYCWKKGVDIYETPDLVEKCMREYFFDLDSIQYLKTYFRPGSEYVLPGTMYYSYYPTGDGDLFPKDPHEALLNGIKFKELLIGNTAREGTFLITTAEPNVFGFFGERMLPRLYNIEIYRAMLKTFWMNYLRSNPGVIFPETMDKYLPGKLKDVDLDMRLFIAAPIGGIVFTCPTAYYAAASTLSGAKVYYYEFKYNDSMSSWARWMRPAHFDEVKYIFGLPISSPGDFHDGDREFSQTMIRHWTDFVKYGKPDVNWPIYGNKSARMVYYNSRSPDSTFGPHALHCKFWWNFLCLNFKSILPKFQGFQDYFQKVAEAVNDG